MLEFQLNQIFERDASLCSRSLCRFSTFDGVRRRVYAPVV